MEVLSSRILLRPQNFEASRVFYAEKLGLAIYREFGQGQISGIVFFVGNGLLELSGQSSTEPSKVDLWFQVRDIDQVHRQLLEQEVNIIQSPKLEPWGLKEMWISDPDGIRIAVIEIPQDHPLRRRI